MLNQVDATLFYSPLRSDVDPNFNAMPLNFVLMMKILYFFYFFLFFFISFLELVRLYRCNDSFIFMLFELHFLFVLFILFISLLQYFTCESLVGVFR